VFAVRFRMGSLLTGTKTHRPPGWSPIAEMMKDAGRLSGKIEESGNCVTRWHPIERSDDGLIGDFRGPADPEIHAAIEAAPALAQSS